MSLSDITINGKVFSVRSIAGSTVLRAATIGSRPGNTQDATLEISHEFSKVKPNRSLIKYNRVVLDGNQVPNNLSIHTVITVPKGAFLPGEINPHYWGTNSMADDLSDILALDTFTFSQRMINGEFS